MLNTPAKSSTIIWLYLSNIVVMDLIICRNSKMFLNFSKVSPFLEIFIYFFIFWIMRKFHEIQVWFKKIFIIFIEFHNIRSNWISITTRCWIFVISRFFGRSCIPCIPLHAIYSPLKWSILYSRYWINLFLRKFSFKNNIYFVNLLNIWISNQIYYWKQ